MELVKHASRNIVAVVEILLNYDFLIYVLYLGFHYILYTVKCELLLSGSPVCFKTIIYQKPAGI